MSEQQRSGMPTSRATLASFAMTLVVLALAACSPDLPEGEFVCSNGGSCPDGWRCLLDDRCYSPDFAGLDVYAPCSVDTDCASRLCLRPFEASTVGQCSSSCESSESCPERPDATVDGLLGGVCAMNMGCIAACTDSDDCGPDQRCVVVPMTAGETACVNFDDTSFSGRQSCRGPNDCAEGLFCLRDVTRDVEGVCSWPCSPGGTCPTGATCEPLGLGGSLPMHACLATCNNTPGSCGSPQLVCAAFPMTVPHCVPPGWAP